MPSRCDEGNGQAASKSVLEIFHQLLPRQMAQLQGCFRGREIRNCGDLFNAAKRLSHEQDYLKVWHWEHCSVPNVLTPIKHTNTADYAAGLQRRISKVLRNRQCAR
jgi:hypothetical protein